MAEIAVVGAGLSGLVAAINCARAGHKVTVLEKYDRVGGEPENHPSVDSTPMLPDRLGSYIGVELKPPQVTPTRTMRSYAYGDKYDIDGGLLHLHAVERGARSTSIENYLYGSALEAGVSFEFGWRLRSQADLEELPPNSIIATGLHLESFLALDIPFRQVYGYTSTTRYEGEPKAVAYFGDLTRDYCYLANANGIAYALFFDRGGPVRRELVDRWAEMLKRDEGVEFREWRLFQGAVAVRDLDNPRLFVGDKIIAGTLASMNDPLFLFGVHASLLSGKIAATAVDDKAKAYGLFRGVLSFYRKAWALRRLMDATPMAMRRHAMRAFLGISRSRPGLYAKIMSYQIPGFRQVEAGQVSLRGG
ncbi:MAG: FAD-dependent oxidoreductase [Actinomycetota bacterium]|nr:FAD-dependent oxidoreductase [Actinomycetota bacterium]